MEELEMEFMKKKMIKFLEMFDDHYNNIGHYTGLYRMFKKLYRHLLGRFEVFDDMFYQYFFDASYGLFPRTLSDIGFWEYIELPSRVYDFSEPEWPELYEYYVLTQKGYIMLDICMEKLNDLKEKYDAGIEELNKDYIKHPEESEKQGDELRKDFNSKIRQALYETWGA